MKRFWYFPLALIAVLSIIGCGEAEAIEETPEPTVQVAPTNTPRPTPTLIPTPIPEPQIVYIEVTPVPTSAPPSDEPLDQSVDEPEGEESAPQDEAGTALTIEPTPVPTPRYRLAARSAQDTGYKGLTFPGTPTVSNKVLSFHALIDGKGNEPSQVQLYHSLRKDDFEGDGECNTDHPIVFSAPGQGGGVTSFQWEFCPFTGTKPLIYVDDIPWVAPVNWTYKLRDRRRIFDPYLYDLSVSVDLGSDKVQELMYDAGEGYILVIFSGETILTKVWIDG